MEREVDLLHSYLCIDYIAEVETRMRIKPI